MKRREKVAAATGVFGTSRARYPGLGAHSRDDSIFDIAGQGMVEGEEVIGHADGQIEKE